MGGSLKPAMSGLRRTCTKETFSGIVSYSALARRNRGRERRARTWGAKSKSESGATHPSRPSASRILSKEIEKKKHAT